MTRKWERLCGPLDWLRKSAVPPFVKADTNDGRTTQTEGTSHSKAVKREKTTVAISFNDVHLVCKCFGVQLSTYCTQRGFMGQNYWGERKQTYTRFVPCWGCCLLPGDILSGGRASGVPLKTRGPGGFYTHAQTSKYREFRTAVLKDVFRDRLYRTLCSQLIRQISER